MKNRREERRISSKKVKGARNQIKVHKVLLPPEVLLPEGKNTARDLKKDDRSEACT